MPYCCHCESHLQNEVESYEKVINDVDAQKEEAIRNAISELHGELRTTDQAADVEELVMKHSERLEEIAECLEHEKARQLANAKLRLVEARKAAMAKMRK